MTTETWIATVVSLATGLVALCGVIGKMWRSQKKERESLVKQIKEKERDIKKLYERMLKEKGDDDE